MFWPRGRKGRRTRNMLCVVHAENSGAERKICSLRERRRRSRGRGQQCEIMPGISAWQWPGLWLVSIPSSCPLIGARVQDRMRGRVRCFCPGVRPASPEYRALPRPISRSADQTGNDRGNFAKILNLNHHQHSLPLSRKKWASRGCKPIYPKEEL